MNPKSRYLYKYLPFDDGSLKVITDGTIKFSHPDDFNDPFDCLPHYNEDSIPKALHKRKDLTKRVGNALKLSPAKRIMHRKKFEANIRKVISSGEFCSGANHKIGLLCLSRDPLNILMWSHYADKHKGFVLEFEPQLDHSHALAFPHELLIAHEVFYQEERPIIDILSGTQEAFDLHFLTKSSAWKYEQEERVIDYARGPGFHFYERDITLKSVIVGLKASKENRENMRSIISNMNKERGLEITLEETYILQKTFGLGRKQIPLTS